jgi:hypothetical protein
MSKKLMIALIAGAMMVVVCASAGAQTPEDSLVVYAKAGRVNLVKGIAGVMHTASDPGQQLAEGDELAAGDLVCTGPGGRLEVLLSPGVYLRLAENSVFQMVTTDLDDIHLFLRRGSAIIEAGQGLDNAFLVQAAMPSGTAMLGKRGSYRLNVVGKRSEVLVRTGETTIEPLDLRVKEGKRVAVVSGVAEPVAKIEKDAAPDALDSWNAERTDNLAKANQSLNQGDLSRAVGTLAAANARRGGYWVYSRQLGYSVFVPNGPGSTMAAPNDAWSGRNRPEARGIGDGPASTVVPAGARGSASNPGTQTPGRP